MRNSEFDRKVRCFHPALPNQCSTSTSSSRDAVLRYISEGTRYCRARLAYHPYTRVTQAEYTSTGCGPPPTIKLASPCSGIDRAGFGSDSCDWSPFQRMPLVSCGRSLSLRFSSRHTNKLHGSCFKKNDKTLVKMPRSNPFGNSLRHP